MKNLLKIFVLSLTIVISSNISKGQYENLTFSVRATNFLYYDTITNTDPLISGIYNKFTFDIYIQQTNIPQNDVEKMRFALGQYYWNLNLDSGFPGDTTGFLGYASVTYVPGSTTFSNPNAIPTSPSFLAKNASSDNLSPEGYPTGTSRSSIRMNSNIALGSSSNVQISGSYPGTRVGSYIVRKKVTVANPDNSFPWRTLHMRFRLGPLNVNSVNPFTKIFAYPGLGVAATEVTSKGTFIMDTAYSFLGNGDLLLTVIPEGYYNKTTKELSKRDTITVDFWIINPPFIIGYYVSRLGVIDPVYFKCFLNIEVSLPRAFYIVVKHKNCLETWSSNTVSLFFNGGTYDFTTSQSQASGNNQKQVDNNPVVRYGIISGDINKDAIIDASDLSLIENDVEAGLTGNLLTDVTGDDFADANDLSIVENNLGAIAIGFIPWWENRGEIAPNH